MIHKLQALKKISLYRLKKNLKQKVFKIPNIQGRNNMKKIVVFNKGHKKKKLKCVSPLKLYRGVLEQFEYDPIKNSLLARVYDIDRKKHFYSKAVVGSQLGSSIKSNFNIQIKIGNRCCIQNIPTGSLLNNVEKTFCKKDGFFLNKVFYAKSAGTYCQLIQKNENFCLIRLPSGSLQKIPPLSFAGIGINSNQFFCFKNIGKAGRSRWLNRRPKVRGVAMNPVDHPHGGGEGKSSGGRPSVSAWGRIIKNK